MTNPVQVICAREGNRDALQPRLFTMWKLFVATIRHGWHAQFSLLFQHDNNFLIAYIIFIIVITIITNVNNQLWKRL